MSSLSSQKPLGLVQTKSLSIPICLFSFFFSFFLLPLGLLGCSDSKTVTSVFPDYQASPPASSPPPSSSTTTSAPDASSACQAHRIYDQFIVAWENGSISTFQNTNAEQFISDVVTPNLSQILRVEYDQKIYLLGGDQKILFSQSKGLSNSWGQEITQAPKVWGEGVLGQGVTVGVIDSPVDYHHSQLKSQLAINEAEKNGIPEVDDDGNGLVDDIYGWDFLGNRPEPLIEDPKINVHGTHVAGIIAAAHTPPLTAAMALPTTTSMETSLEAITETALTPSSSPTVKGMAPGAKIIPANFMDPEGAGTLSSAISALNYAVTRGARIINASWGGSGCSPILEKTIQDLSKKDVLFINASGNDSQDLDISPQYPVSFNLPLQLSVAATRFTDRLASFSNTSYNVVHIGAPGENIYSTIPGDKYGLLTGTSMASPFVTGAAALLWSACPKAKAQDIRQALLDGVDVLDYRVSTKGRLNVERSLMELRRRLPASLCRDS